MSFEVDVCITTIVIDILIAFAMCFIMGSTHSFILNGNKEQKFTTESNISTQHGSRAYFHFLLQTKNLDADK